MGIRTLIIYVANSYLDTNLLEGVKTDQIEMLSKLSGITGINVGDMDPLIEYNKMIVIRYPDDHSKSRIVMCFDNGKSELISNLKMLARKYKSVINVVFVFTGYGENSTDSNNLMTNDSDSINVKQIIDIVGGVNIFCYLDYCKSKTLIPKSQKKIKLDDEKRYVIMTAGLKDQAECTTKFNGSHMMKEIIKNIEILGEPTLDDLFIFTELIGTNIVSNQLVRSYYKDMVPLIKIIEQCKILERDKNINPFQLAIQLDKKLRTISTDTLYDWENCIKSHKHFNNAFLHASNPKIIKLIPQMTEMILTICNKLPYIRMNDLAIKKLNASSVKYKFVQLIDKKMCNTSIKLKYL